MADPLLLDLELRPHRSLTPIGFRVVMAVLIAFGVLSGFLFLVLGAWPVLGFLGLDVILVYLAFRASYAGGRVHEHIRLSPAILTVERVDRRGRQRRFELQPHWLRVDVSQSPSGLRLSSRGRSVDVGAFLPPGELEDVATQIRAALARLRRPGSYA